MLLVAAGDPVDAVIRGTAAVAGPRRSHHRQRQLPFHRYQPPEQIPGREKSSLHGPGDLRGETGARSGPSLMPGGSREMYDRVAPILEAVAAHVKGEPCVTYLGACSAGHYVKMVHNGIEYGLMELIAETYDLLKRGLGLYPAELAPIYDRWNREELNSFLIEITARSLPGRMTAPASSWWT